MLCEFRFLKNLKRLTIDPCGVFTYLEWCEQCVFTDGQGRHDSAHSAHDKFTKYWGQRRQCAAVERVVFASVLQHHLNYEL